MEYELKSGAVEKQTTACLIAGLFESGALPDPLAALDQASGGHIKAILRRGDIEGKKGQTLMLHEVPGLKAERLLLVGLGKRSEFDASALRQAAATAARAADASGAMEAVSLLALQEARGVGFYRRVRHLVEAGEEALYSFDRLKSDKPRKRRPLKRLVIAAPGRSELKSGREAVRHATAIAAGQALARDLGNLPGNICTPAYLAREARKLAKGVGRLSVRVLEEAEMKRLGMGALLSVARGSREPAKLIVLQYKGGARGERPVALVGKGVTFDSGGISLKPGQAMDEMKFDMCGAASVLGALKAAVELELPLNIVGLIPATENLPDGGASKPGDIVTSMSGQTIEILNTDAEGRLILCDALTYASRFKPDAVIDIATLTGACVIALGSHAAGLLANDDDLAEGLLEAGRKAQDRAWRLPLWEDYQKQLDSNFADMANIGGREAGTITAACFLSRFTRDYHWAHLDIAGVAWKQGKEKGATGRPVALLTQYLLDRSA